VNYVFAGKQKKADQRIAAEVCDATAAEQRYAAG
jgi:hypothetical protein